MRFEWDSAKAAGNLRKHGVSFREEERLVTFGFSSARRLIVVCHTEHDNVIRIISARRATQTEREIYEEGEIPH
jgi:uncharacterized protein